MESVKKTVHLAERYISMIMIPPLFGIIIFAGPIMHVIFDESFAPAIPVLTVMIIYCFIRAVNTPYSTLIGGINRPDIIGKLGVTTCLANIILNYLIIPKDGLLAEFGISGATGAAFTTALSFLIAFFVLRIMAKKITGISLIQNHSPRHFISGLIMGTILYYLAYKTNYFPVFYWHSLVGLGLLGLGIYVLFLWLFREFDKQDFEFFLNIIHPKKMVTYMKEELKNNKKK
jgi:O-antigen/teichoic acid export membrane protein